LLVPLINNPSANESITVVLLGTWTRNDHTDMSSVVDARVQDENRMTSPKKIAVAYSIYPTSRSGLTQCRRSC
jgi:hypothetical protein